MPIYEYQCEGCNEQTEHLQRFSDPPLASCPRCGGPVRKRISAPAFQFKGNGWYATDYARKGGGGDSAAQGSGGDGAKVAEGKTETKADGTKAEAKAEGKSSGSSASPVA
jgi:putative FmdB family regulatory protein